MTKKRAMVLGLDGADPFIIKKLIADGRMPNMKKLLENGVATEDMSMLGAFPSVTPPNWASIATGNWPRTHGVTCYYNHTLGKNLGISEINWDSRRVKSELIWEAFDRQGKRSLMINYCEAWPPRLQNDEKNVFIDGSGVFPFLRCNLDYQKIVVLEKGDFQIEEKLHAVKTASTDCVVQGDQYERLTKGHLEEKTSQFAPAAESDALIIGPGGSGKPVDDEADQIHSPLKAPENWERELPKDALAAVVPLNGGTARRYFVLTGENTITVYQNRKTTGKVLGQVKKGKWSDWIYDYYVKEDRQVKVGYKLRWLESGSDDNKVKLYVSYAQNLDDLSYTYPMEMGRKLFDEVGPALCFAKFGQVTKTDWRDHDVLLESFEDNIKWHIDASNWLFEEYPDWDLYYIHLHAPDLMNHWYLNQTLPGSDPDWKTRREYLYRLYVLHDVYIGEMMKQLDGNTSIFVCSDHGAVPRDVGVKNPGIGSIGGITTTVMEELGFTKTYKDENGKLKIDYSKSRAIFHRSSFVYVNLKGRDPQGIVEPEDLEKTVQEIIDALYAYRDKATGRRVVAFCMTRDEMESVGMGGPHCGDILCQLVPAYCTSEHANCPSTVSNQGFSMNDLCVMGGAGFKKGYTMKRVVRVTDVVPTICYLTGTKVPSNVEGGVIWQALEGFEEKKYE